LPSSPIVELSQDEEKRENPRDDVLFTKSNGLRRFLSEASTSQVSGSGIANTLGGVTNTVNVQTRDSLGNNLSTGGEVFKLFIDNPYSEVLMTDNNDGTYSASYTVSAYGTINVSVYKIELGVNGLYEKLYPTYYFTGNPTTSIAPKIDYNWGTGYVITGCY